MRTSFNIVVVVFAAVLMEICARAATTEATTTKATGQSNTVATLNGTVNPNGAETTAWFEWGLYPFNNTNITAPVAVGSGSAAVGVSVPLSGLTPGINYHARLVASNAFGVVRGLDAQFGSPVLTLNGPSNLRIGYQGIFNDPGATAMAAPLGIAGAANHSLVLKSDGSIFAWGTNNFGQINVPQWLGNVVAIAAGYSHSLALRPDGTVVGWGTQTNTTVGLSNVVAITAGYYHSLALRHDGTVIAWGSNSSGQTNVPQNLSNVVAVVGGYNHCLALKGDGTVTAWGGNTSGQTNIPAGLSNVVAIAGGAEHGLALKRDGTVAAWGPNTSGQTTIPLGLSNVVAIAGGANHCLALRRDGTVAAWGANGDGQTNVPAGLSNVVAITGGAHHNLTIKHDGTVVAWGWNGEGQTNIPPGLGTLPVIAAGGVDAGIPGSYTIAYSSSNSLGGVGTNFRTVVVASLLTNVTRIDSGSFRFSFTNLPGKSFTVFASTNIALPFDQWANLGPVIEGPAGQYQFTDPAALNSPRRFYVVRSP